MGCTLQVAVRRRAMQYERNAAQVATVRTDERENCARGGRRTRRLRLGDEVLKSATTLFAREGGPSPLVLAFADRMQVTGCAVESILATLKQEDLEITARTGPDTLLGRTAV
ncbi:hypothetical protein ADK55_07665 [Streptomyces sp. WM4235]|uniref:hypothetical protein n=1 Tax=Streptomyces sp. WM4235 TaxID=1415551 RepID=UPI0006AE3C30|nr:hypothetical protein [Streptomyces sp. WM4235]KOU64301.1 hypothetical protein ADK55_07665 [Streptomyces sp. WM4235]